MAMQDTDFWRRAGKAAPGLFDLGVGVYGMSAAEDEAEQRLKAAQGPQYDAALAASSTALKRAGSLDPQKAAQQRFKAQSGLLAGKDAADEAALLRMLHHQGMLDVANFNPGVKGITPSGVAMNPHLAAFYAGRGARDATMAADSLDYGDRTLDNMLKRSGMLQDQAAARQRMGLEASRTQPSRAASRMNLLKGGAGILRDTGLLNDLWKGAQGLFGDDGDWFTSMDELSIDW